jgi:hypothetical protein
MLKNRVERKAPADYKEPYEFRLLIGDNIICQRYFRINNFNPLSLHSVELTDVIRSCGRLIDEDLKSKSRVYTWHIAPFVFTDEEEMRQWFSKPENAAKVRLYENIALTDESGKEFTWDGETLIECEKKINDGTFTVPIQEKDVLTYEFAFYVNDKKIVSTIFDGIYPYFIRRNIDLSNTRGKFENDDLSRLSFESYILNRLVYDRQDLIKRIVKDICYVCSATDNNYYTLAYTFKQPNGKKIKYPLNIGANNQTTSKKNNNQKVNN